PRGGRGREGAGTGQRDQNIGPRAEPLTFRSGNEHTRIAGVAKRRPSCLFAYARKPLTPTLSPQGGERERERTPQPFATLRLAGCASPRETGCRRKAPSPRLRGEGWGEGLFPQLHRKHFEDALDVRDHIVVPNTDDPVTESGELGVPPRIGMTVGVRS